jgi:hypothetical protein
MRAMLRDAKYLPSKRRLTKLEKPKVPCRVGAAITSGLARNLSNSIGARDFDSILKPCIQRAELHKYF